MPTEKDQAESLRRKGELLHLMGYPKEAKIFEEVSKLDEMPDDFILDVTPEEMWKLKEILAAAGVPATKTADGKMTFDKNTVAGKQIKVLYTQEVDSRPVEEGGKGTKYTKASAAYPADTTEESLGI